MINYKVFILFLRKKRAVNKSFNIIFLCLHAHTLQPVCRERARGREGRKTCLRLKGDGLISGLHQVASFNLF